MNLKDEMVERMKGSLELGPNAPEDVFTGWGIQSDGWSDSTQAAVDAVMNAVNTLAEMILRLAESIDELRDAPNV
jgi:hypothetical protein